MSQMYFRQIYTCVEERRAYSRLRFEGRRRFLRDLFFSRQRFATVMDFVGAGIRSISYPRKSKLETYKKKKKRKTESIRQIPNKRMSTTNPNATSANLM